MKKKSKGVSIFGWLFIITGLAYLPYAIYCLFEAFTSDCGLGLFFCFWLGFPFLLVGLFKIRFGTSLIKGDFCRGVMMLIVLGVLEAISGFFFLQIIIPRKIFLVYCLLFYGGSIYILHPSQKVMGE